MQNQASNDSIATPRLNNNNKKKTDIKTLTERIHSCYIQSVIDRTTERQTERKRETNQQEHKWIEEHRPYFYSTLYEFIYISTKNIWRRVKILWHLMFMSMYELYSVCLLQLLHLPWALSLYVVHKTHTHCGHSHSIRLTNVMWAAYVCVWMNSVHIVWMYVITTKSYLIGLFL